MFIKDLQARQTNVDVEGEVLEVSDVREFSKYGRQGRVANAMIKDGTGKVKLSLWNEQIEKVQPGDTVKIQKGYVGEFQGELQLTTGKFGTLEVVKGGEQGTEAPTEEPQEETETAPAPQEEPTPEEPKEEPKPEAPSEPEPEEPAEEKKEKPIPEESIDVEEEDLS
jgi:replication factor A1